jgi:hypothetical protein
VDEAGTVEPPRDILVSELRMGHDANAPVTGLREWLRRMRARWAPLDYGPLYAIPMSLYRERRYFMKCGS